VNRRICRGRILTTTRAGRTRSSNIEDDPLRRQINDIERVLWHDDPTLMLRIRRLQRLDTASVLTVFALMAIGSVLVTVGAATSTITVGGSGLIAMVAACLINRRHQRTLRQPPQEAAESPNASAPNSTSGSDPSP
jgi:hypothetical protein